MGRKQQIKEVESFTMIDFLTRKPGLEKVIIT